MKRFFAFFLAALLLFSVTASAEDSDYLKWRKRFINLSADELQSAARALVSAFTPGDLVTFRDNVDRVIAEQAAASSSPLSLTVNKRYTCYMDLHADNNSNRATVYNFDAMTFDLYFTYDTSSVYCSFSIASKDGITDSGLIQAQYEPVGDNFNLVFADDERYPGYYDTNGEDLWLNFGIGYCRFRLVPKFDPYANR